MADVRIEFNQQAVHLMLNTPEVAHAVDRIAAELVNEMKRRAPVRKVEPVYARGGRPVSGGTRRAGDFPLRPSGYLRSSVHAFREGDSTVIIGPTASYSRFVIEGTRPHTITSHGPWPLRNRATGAVFGRTVHHPGTRPQPFVWEAVTEVASRHIRVEAA